MKAEKWSGRADLNCRRFGCAERPSQSILMLRALALRKVGTLRGSAVLSCLREALLGKIGVEMVGTGRFELPTPRTPSECSTRLSHVPT